MYNNHSFYILTAETKLMMMIIEAAVLWQESVTSSYAVY